ncbi:hypothetical protein B0H10DRAFT_2011520, partial [Mycena sp. CBHHK59/15]
TTTLPRSDISKVQRVSSSDSEMDIDQPPESRELIWDGFPDGDFCHLFSYTEAKALNNLMVHWPYSVLGGKPNQSATAETWQGGKTTRRKCHGVIKCENKSCAIIVRPQSTLARIQHQLSKDCRCGAALSHIPCPIISTLYSFKYGIYYENGGHHDHPRCTHRLHLFKLEKEEFQEIVTAHPRNGPLRLLVGVPGVNGPGKSVADISPVLMNTDRIKHERKQVLGKKNGKGADGVLADFAAFEKAHPGFIRQSTIGVVSVITMQTPFMAAQLNEAVNGIVSDATYSFFLALNAMLFISSVYSHYRLHFLQLILSSWKSVSGEAFNIQMGC